MENVTKPKTSTKPKTNKQVKTSTQPKTSTKPKQITQSSEHVLSPKAFNIKINTQAIFDTIMFERASQRQGTHNVKNRSEVRGGGKKPYAQKHTGKSRAGSIRSPIWVGGGVAFGPKKEKNYKLKINKKVRKLAFLSSLTLKAKAKAIIINEIKMDKISTKDLLEKIKSLKLKDSFKKILIISESKILFKSSQNLQKVEVQKLSGLNVEQIVNADVLIISIEDVKKIEGMVK